MSEQDVQKIMSIKGRKGQHLVLREVSNEMLNCGDQQVYTDEKQNFSIALYKEHGVFQVIFLQQLGKIDKENSYVLRYIPTKELLEDGYRIWCSFRTVGLAREQFKRFIRLGWELFPEVEEEKS